MSRLVALWTRLTDSLWFYPAALTLLGAVLAHVLVHADPLVLGDASAREYAWLFAGTAEGARGMLGAIASSIITVTGVVFSVTIVALQLASQQFTPRVLRQFTSDRANQVVLGVFIGTFTYTLLVQRTVRGAGEEGEPFVPSVAITVAIAFALVSIGFLIFFIDHAARSIQADSIMKRVTNDTLGALPVVGSEPAYVTAVPDGLPPETEPVEVVADRSGYVQGIDEARLVELAGENDLLLRIEARVGQFVMAGVPVLAAWGGELPEETAAALRDCFVVGSGRTPHRDPELGIIELMDIAVKALSPGVNDPTTAMMAIDRLGEILVAIGAHGDVARARADETGAVRLLLPGFAFERMVSMAFDQVRHYGVGNPSVVVKLLTTMGEVAGLVGPAERRVLASAMRHTLAGAEAAVEDPGDAARVRRKAAEALARAADP